MISLTEYLLQDMYYHMPFYEHAMSRNRLFDKITNHIEMLLAHWGLIEYATGDFDAPYKYTQCIKHWKKELIEKCSAIAKNKIKGGNRKKAIKYCLINTHEINDWEVVYNYIKDKFNEEDIDLMIAKRVAKLLVENVDELIEALVKQTYIEWVNEL